MPLAPVTFQRTSRQQVAAAPVDLHVHTTFSDGLFTPDQVVTEAKRLGLAAVAITDHDSVDGIERAIATGRKLKVEVVPGAELSTNVSGVDVHLLAYLINYKSPVVKAFFAEVRKKRLERAEKMVAKLRELGVGVEFKRVIELAGDGAIGRPHVAQAIVEAGGAASISEAFSRYIGYDGPAYFPKMKLTPLEVVDFVHQHDGLVVIAHPATYGNDDVVYTAIAAGVDGIEVWHPDHDKTNVAHYQELAQKNGLLVTGGSDCHGGRKAGMVYLGSVEVPYLCLAQLKRLVARNAK